MVYNTLKPWQKRVRTAMNVVTFESINMYPIHSNFVPTLPNICHIRYYDIANSIIYDALCVYLKQLYKHYNIMTTVNGVGLMYAAQLHHTIVNSFNICEYAHKYAIILRQVCKGRQTILKSTYHFIEHDILTYDDYAIYCYMLQVQLCTEYSKNCLVEHLLLHTCKIASTYINYVQEFLISCNLQTIKHIQNYASLLKIHDNRAYSIKHNKCEILAIKQLLNVSSTYTFMQSNSMLLSCKLITFLFKYKRQYAIDTSDVIYSIQRVSNITAKQLKYYKPKKLMCYDKYNMLLGEHTCNVALTHGKAKHLSKYIHGKLRCINHLHVKGTKYCKNAPYFRSYVELSCIVMLEFLKIPYMYESIKVPYYYHKLRYYIPDIVIYYKHAIIYIELKYSIHQLNELDYVKFESITEYCKQHTNTYFTVLTQYNLCSSEFFIQQLDKLIE